MKKLMTSGVIALLIGAGFIALSIAFPDKSIFFGLAGAAFGQGLLMLFKYGQWKKSPQTYAEKAEVQAIDAQDERKEMIRGKAARYSILANWMFQSLIMVTLTLLAQFDVLPDDFVQPVVLGIAAYWIITAVMMQVIYKRLSKRY